MSQHHKILLGLLVGLVLGLFTNLVFGQTETVTWIISNIAYPIGQIFLRFVFMAVIPLIFSAIALGIYDMGDVKKIGKVGGKTLLFTVVITLTGVLIAIFLVNIIQPGYGLEEADRDSLITALSQRGDAVGNVLTSAKESKSFVQTILDIIPRNPFMEATFAFDGAYRGGGLLALMFFSVIFGISMALGKRERIAPVEKFLKGIYEITMQIIGMAMRFAPYGVAGLIYTTSAQLGFQILALLAKYVFVVLLALTIHMLVTYSAILRFGTSYSPKAFFKNISEIIVTAFSTSSSSATLPTAIRVSNKFFKKRPDIVNFVLTIGATANQNGTALYEGITVLFLAQFYSIELTIAQQVMVVLLSVLAGVGTAGVPGGSLPLVVLTLQLIGVPAEGIGIILGVDRVLDMSRTVINVTGDVTLAAWVIEKEPTTETLALTDDQNSH